MLSVCTLLSSLCSCLSLSPSVRSSIPPSPWLANTGAAFQQCPLSKHLYCGMLLPLLCQTKPPCQWNNPAGRRPSPGSFGAVWPHQNSRPNSPSPAMIAGQEINFVCVCWQQTESKVHRPRSLIYPTNRFFFKCSSSLSQAACLVRDVIHLKLEHPSVTAVQKPKYLTFTAARESVASFHNHTVVYITAVSNNLKKTGCFVNIRQVHLSAPMLVASPKCLCVHISPKMSQIGSSKVFTPLQWHLEG